MKYLIPTIGSRGDVQPYIALACGLQRVGHEVKLATHPSMRGLAESYGLTFAPIGPDIDIGEEAARLRAGSPNWLLGFMRVMNFSWRILEQAHPDILALCRNVDQVIVPHCAAGSVEADLLGLSTISVTLMPQAIPVNDPSEPALKRFMMKLAGSAMGLMMTRPLNQIRKRVGLPTMGPTGITSPRLNLIAISPIVFPPHPLWEPRHQMTGYWFSDEPNGWKPPDRLCDFLATGEPPIVISLGAMSTGEADANATAQIAINAVQQAGLRAIVQGWDRALSRMSLPETVLPLGPAPHSWLLVRAAGVVHHGGFGTTGAGLRAGVPSLVIPHIIDQFIWGDRVHQLGAGPRPIPRSKLTVERFASALDELVNDQEMRQRAHTIGRQIREERGVENALQRIEEVAV